MAVQQLYYQVGGGTLLYSSKHDDLHHLRGIRERILAGSLPIVLTNRGIQLKAVRQTARYLMAIWVVSTYHTNEAPPNHDR